MSLWRRLLALSAWRRLSVWIVAIVATRRNEGFMEGENFADWLPKMEVAEELGISERTLERLIQQKRIRRAYRRMPGRKPLAVLHPDDVAALKAETVPPSSAPPLEPRRTDVALRPTTQAALHFLADLLAAIPQRPQTLFLTLKEASQYSGLPLTDIERLIESGELKVRKVRKGRAQMIKRTDLEGL
jgi:excisionase family DNA binding protein